MASFVRRTLDDGTATVTLSRAELHNAFNEVVIEELTAAFSALDRDDMARVVLFASEGKSFSAGADVNWMERMVDYSYLENVEDAGRLGGMLRAIRTCSKPVIARVHGPVFGGGIGLVAACDVALAVRTATFALTEVKLGIAPAVIFPYVVEKIGAGAARRYALTAERFDADEAKRIGLINEVVDSVAVLDSRIAEIATAVKANSPKAMATCKRILSEVGGAPWETLQRLTAECIAELRVSPEGQEGLRAFLEKRRPGWM